MHRLRTEQISLRYRRRWNGWKFVRIALAISILTGCVATLKDDCFMRCELKGLRIARNDWRLRLANTIALSLTLPIVLSRSRPSSVYYRGTDTLTISPR